MQRFTVVGLAIVSFSGCQCDKEVVAVPGDLTGTVCNEAGDPISGAVVSIGDGPTKKDPTSSAVDGTYSFQGLLPGAYLVKADYEGTTREFTTIVEAREIAVIDDDACRTDPGTPDSGSLIGQVCNRHTGDLVTDAEVTVSLATGGLVTGLTDSEGRFALDGLPEGEHIVNITGVGYQRAFLVQIEVDRIAELDLAFDCESVDLGEGGIVGRFCDPAEGEGSHLVNADVVAVGVDVEDDGVDMTDTNGQFEINALSPGAYDVTITHPSLTITRRVDVRAGELSPLDDPSECAEPARVGAIVGAICNFEAGGTFTGTVQLQHVDGSLVEERAASAGQFRFDEVPEGTYRLFAFQDGTSYERLFEGIVVTAFTEAFVQDSGECPAPEDICTQFTSTPDETADGRILLVVDKSGSMTASFASGGVKWNALRQALVSVTAALNSVVDFGLVLYPRRNGGDCDQGTEIVDVAANTAGTIEAELNATSANGGTPTAASLAVARQIVQPLLADGRPIAVVLATDGGPNCNQSLNSPATCECTDAAFQGQCPATACLDDQNSYAAVSALSALGVKTYVVGITGAESYSYVLDQMAILGGTAQPGPSGQPMYYEANDPQALQTALDEITTEIVSCTVTTDVALASVNSITVTVGSQTVVRDIARVNGWDVVNANTIELFGAACEIAAGSADPITVETCVSP